MSTKRTRAVDFLQDLVGGPLTLGDLLHSIRRGEDMSQVEFARQLGLSRSHLCDIEKGRKAVSPRRSAEFARRLGYSERQFVQLALQDQIQDAGLDFEVQLVAAPA